MSAQRAVSTSVLFTSVKPMPANTLLLIVVMVEAALPIQIWKSLSPTT